MKTYSNRSGFTLIEVIAILVIMVIISAVALTRLTSSQNNLIAATDTLTSHLRLAQARAMSTSADNISALSVWGVRFVSATQYHLFYCADANACAPAANQTAFPGGSIIMDLTKQGVQVTNGALVLSFDRFGTPYTDALATLTTPLASQLTLTLKDNNGNTRTINITPQTGMIK